MNKIFEYNLEEVNQIALNIIKLQKDFRIFLFTGSLGAGKTTLIKEILKLSGIEQNVVSPTFSYFIAYENNFKKFYHFDLYRLTDFRSFIDMGFLDLLNENNAICLIEWPEIIEPLLSNMRICKVNLEYKDEENRRIFIDF